MRHRRAATAGVAQDAAPVRRERRVGRGRLAAARGAWAVGSVMLLIARVIRLVVMLVVLVIVVAIILRVLGANASNTIVKDIHDAGSTLAGPFKNVFSIHGAKLAMAVNWGLAALVYAIVGGFVARLIARGAPLGEPPVR